MKVFLIQDCSAESRDERFRKALQAQFKFTSVT